MKNEVILSFVTFISAKIATKNNIAEERIKYNHRYKNVKYGEGGIRM